MPKPGESNENADNSQTHNADNPRQYAERTWAPRLTELEKRRLFNESARHKKEPIPFPSADKPTWGEMFTGFQQTVQDWQKFIFSQDSGRGMGGK